MSECDFSMLLSQDLIAKVMEEHLNKQVLRQQVEVVDLQNTDAGYVFSLRYKPKVEKVIHIKQQALHMQSIASASDMQTIQHEGKVHRASNGKFTSKVKGA